MRGKVGVPGGLPSVPARDSSRVAPIAGRGNYEPRGPRATSILPTPFMTSMIAACVRVDVG